MRQDTRDRPTELVNEARLGLTEAGAVLNDLEDDVDRELVADDEWALLGALRRVRKLKGRAEA